MSEGELQAAALSAPLSARDVAMSLLQYLFGGATTRRNRTTSQPKSGEHGPNEMQMHTFAFGGGGPVEHELGVMSGRPPHMDRDHALPSGSSGESPAKVKGVKEPSHADKNADGTLQVLKQQQQGDGPASRKDDMGVGCAQGIPEPEAPLCSDGVGHVSLTATADFCLRFMAHVLHGGELVDIHMGEHLMDHVGEGGSSIGLARVCSDGILPRWEKSEKVA